MVLLIFCFSYRIELQSIKVLALQNKEDPFLVKCNFEGICVTPLQLAFKTKQSGRVLPFLEITKGKFTFTGMIYSHLAIVNFISHSIQCGREYSVLSA